MRPTTTNSPAGGMSGWPGTANLSVPTTSGLNALQDRTRMGASPMQNGGSLPGKGGGSTLQPAPGGAGGNALAGLFMGNSPAVAGPAPSPLPVITQPREPIIGMPPERRPLPPTAPQQPAPLPRFGTLGELRGYMIQNPGKLSPEQVNQWKRVLQSRGGR